MATLFIIANFYQLRRSAQAKIVGLLVAGGKGEGKGKGERERQGEVEGAGEPPTD